MSTVGLEQFQWERLMEVLWTIAENTKPLPDIIQEAPKPEPGILGRLMDANQTIEGACMNRSEIRKLLEPK